MSNSDWITIWGIVMTFFIAIVGSIWVVAFQMGGLRQHGISMAKVLQDLSQGIQELSQGLQDLSHEQRVFSHKLQDLSRDVSGIKYALGQVIVKVDVLWHGHFAKANSPIVLNEEGLRLLQESGIGVFASLKYPEIVAKIKAMNPKNAYQAQGALTVVLSEYQNVEEYRLTFQDAAFLSGSDVDSILFVAALSIRDMVIDELGFG